MCLIPARRIPSLSFGSRCRDRRLSPGILIPQYLDRAFKTVLSKPHRFQPQECRFQKSCLGATDWRSNCLRRVYGSSEAFVGHHVLASHFFVLDKARQRWYP